MSHPIKETDIFSALPNLYGSKEPIDLETPLPDREDPETLVATLKTQAKLLKLFEEHGHIDRSGKHLETELRKAIVDLEAFLRAEESA